jgi:acetoin utilization deacetylase AcuC-like enzyme
MPSFHVVYSDCMVADPGHQTIFHTQSPSAGKPKLVAEALKVAYPDLEFHEPDRMMPNDFYRCHDRAFVDDVFAKRRPNGFGTISDEVNASLPYTSGAMYQACRLATPDNPAAALVSGFHHAGYDGFEEHGYFCTFNGLMASALKMIEERSLRRVAIIDCDQHFGNGTDETIQRLRCRRRVAHLSFGGFFYNRLHTAAYLEFLNTTQGVVKDLIQKFKPGLILYQAGADVHVDDPLGGVLDEDQMRERDRRMFTIARDEKVPLAWCLAGGYQVDPDGGIGTVLRLHLNTFDECEKVYGG